MKKPEPWIGEHPNLHKEKGRRDVTDTLREALIRIETMACNGLDNPLGQSKFTFRRVVSEARGALAATADAPEGPWEAYRRWATGEDGASYETCWWGVCGKEDEDLSYNVASLTEPQAIAVRDALNLLHAKGG